VTANRHADVCWRDAAPEKEGASGSFFPENRLPRIKCGAGFFRIMPWLLQGTVDRGELGIEGRAEPVDRRDDCERDARGDQAVFDGGCPRFVRQEPSDVMLQLRLR